jgi:hypothetical protein
MEKSQNMISLLIIYSNNLQTIEDSNVSSIETSFIKIIPL